MKHNFSTLLYAFTAIIQWSKSLAGNLPSFLTRRQIAFASLLTSEWNEKLLFRSMSVFAGIDFFIFSCWTDECLNFSPLKPVWIVCENGARGIMNPCILNDSISLFIAYSVISRCLANFFLFSPPNSLLYPSFGFLLPSQIRSQVYPGAVLHLNEVPSFSTFQLFAVKIFAKESQKFAVSTDSRPDFLF